MNINDYIIVKVFLKNYRSFVSLAQNVLQGQMCSDQKELRNLRYGVLFVGRKTQQWRSRLQSNGEVLSDENQQWRQQPLKLFGNMYIGVDSERHQLLDLTALPGEACRTSDEVTTEILRIEDLQRRNDNNCKTATPIIGLKIHQRWPKTSKGRCGTVLNTLSAIVILTVSIGFLSCQKFVEIDPPVTTIVSEQAFSNDRNATSSILGIYSKLINQSTVTGLVGFGNSAITMLDGISSDEITFIGGDPNFDPFFKNQILSDNGLIAGNLWRQPYEAIYQANACIEQLIRNTSVTSPLKKQLIGEAKFLRAFIYFYLVNNFGDVPYVTSTNYKESRSAGRTNLNDIYSNIISDLEEAVNELPADFTGYNNERNRATKWSAMALLSRVYLYTKNWTKAYEYSNAVILSSFFNLLPDLNGVFLKNSEESILQFSIDGTINPFNVLPESYLTIPRTRTTFVYFYFPKSFLSEFDLDDKRKVNWIDSTTFLGTTYYFPFKYKIGPAEMMANASPTEYYMVLRLAEQHLIRAEAQVQMNFLSSAENDINILRDRAGLMPTTFTSKVDAMNKIILERKKELFYEWGHRWFDLKRTDRIDSVMNLVAPLKGGAWKPTAALFPIPEGEIFRNSNLRQNSGY